MATHQQAADRVQTGFWVHTACYVAVVGGLSVMNYQRNPDNLWVLWVAGGWGIGLIIHAIAFLTPESRERMIASTEARMDRRAARQERKEAERKGF